MVKQLFTKEDIKKFGFIYEPDESKCKTINVKFGYKNFNDKQGIANGIWTKYVNSVFIVDPPITDEKWGRCDIRVTFKGHGQIDVF